MTTFISGLTLSRRFFETTVRPIMTANFPRLQYAAARIGWGSEILGFDDAISADHDWGPTVMLFLREQDLDQAAAIRATLAAQLPDSFLGFPITKVSDSYDPRHHAVFLTTCRHFFDNHIAWDIRQPLTSSDWLTISSQYLAELTGGAVFQDEVGELTRLRQTLAWYPDPIWRYLMAASWEQISQEGPLMGRAGSVGDELGSALIGSHLVRSSMQLCFLMEKRYAPYAKWFGKAFQQLDCAPTVAPLLMQVAKAQTWQQREAALNATYLEIGRIHNQLTITEPIDAKIIPFHDRPFTLIDSEPFQTALLSGLNSAEFPSLNPQQIIGGIDQWSNSTSLKTNPHWRSDLKQLYQLKAC